MRDSMVIVLVVGLVGLGSACQLWPNSPDDEEPEPAPEPEFGEESELVDWTAPIDVAVGNAFRGPWRMNESQFHYVDDPGVSIGEGGHIDVTWVDNEDQNAFYQRFDADGQPVLDEPTNISNSPDIFSWLPVVASSAADPDTVYVLWQEIIFSGGSHGGEILFARSTDGGESFDEPVNLSETIAGAGKGRLTADRWNNGSLDLVVGPGEQLYVAWTEYEGALRFRRSTDGGETFDDPVHVAGDDEEPMRAPSLAVTDDGTLYLAWTVGERAAIDIQLARSTDGGETFELFDPPAPTEGHSDAPAVAVDGQTVHLVFGDSPEGPFDRYRILYARSTDEGETFESPREISGLNVEPTEAANFPSIAVDEQGRVFATWEYYPNFRQRPMGLGFAVSEDGGEDFESASLVSATADPALGMNGGLQGRLMNKIDANDGTVAVVNSRFLDGEESRVRLIRGEVTR